MILELLIFLERLTEKDMEEFYSRYCEAYGLGNDQRGRVRVERTALKEIYKKGLFEYHTIKDAIFKIKTINHGIRIQTSSQKWVREEPRGETYLNSLEKYFRDKEDAVIIKQIK